MLVGQAALHELTWQAMVGAFLVSSVMALLKVFLFCVLLWRDEEDRRRE
jgi:hypothetical protein